MNPPPPTPADINVFFEDGKFVFRVGEARSIYVFDRDKAGASTCSGACSHEWPPVVASPSSQPVADWTLVKRSDGAKQWRYRNRPIYTYAKDQVGTTFGDGVDGAWHLVTP